METVEYLVSFLSKYSVTLLNLNNVIKLLNDSIPFQSFSHSKMRKVLMNLSYFHC